MHRLLSCFRMVSRESRLGCLASLYNHDKSRSRLMVYERLTPRHADSANDSARDEPVESRPSAPVLNTLTENTAGRDQVLGLERIHDRTLKRIWKRYVLALRETETHLRHARAFLISSRTSRAKSTGARPVTGPVRQSRLNKCQRPHNVESVKN